MVKRKCGTCLYFEDRGVAGSGTCLHPSRRELRDVVLVRQTELACRNSWDQDLWKENPNPVLNPALTGTASGDPDIVFEESTDGHRVVTTSIDDLPAADSSGEGVDRVTSVQIPVTRRTPTIRPHTVSQLDADDEQGWPARQSVHDARRRREQERRRELDEERRTRIAEIGKRMSAADEAVAEVADTASIVRSMSSRPAQPIPVAGREDVPDEAFVAHRTPASPSSHVSGAGFQPSPTLAPVPKPWEDAPSHASEPVSQGTEPLPTLEVGDTLPVTSSVRPLTPVIHDRVASPERGMMPNEPFVYVDGMVPGARTPGREEGPRANIAAPDADDPIDRAERLATVPRCCATCRDFRQVGNGDRGQCTNPYAFSERRMVKSDQLACRSSLGSWWMPNDDIWLERADTSHHGRPTPLLDAALRVQRVSDDGRDSRA